MENLNTNYSLNNEINQILFFIVDKNLYAQTENLEDNALARIQKCIQITKNEYSHAISLQSECVPDAKRLIAQTQKKLDGLRSLSTIAQAR